MVCIFCIAVLAMVAGALTAASLDRIEEQLAEVAEDGVARVSDTESVARFELVVQVGAKLAPVAVTLYKEHRRARIQVLTHELTAEEVERLEELLAEAIDAEIVDRSSPEAEVHDEAHEPARDPERAAERVESPDAPEARSPDAEREREPGPPRE